MALLKKLGALCAAGTLVAGLAACGSDNAGASQSAPAPDAPTGALTVFATTGYLGDAVANIAPEAQVTVMVKPGGDPHTYQPTTQDIEAMQSADVVVWNGLHLEALMTDQLESQGDRALEVGKNIPADLLLDWPETDDHGNPLYDPHIWNSPEIWQNVVTQVADKLAQVDADNADAYKKNAEAYNAKIQEIDEKAAKTFETIPEANRVLITGHDAFNYLGNRYNMTVHATDFVTSEAQLSAADLEELATLIADAKVPTIFVDNLQNPQAITSLQEAVASKGWDVKVADEELYADSLGEAAPVDTYLGVFQHNIDAITAGLGAQ
ncbi:metal ABC transporter substrate-binding protein [Actinomyces sp. B33]|uniref:metal ABC transporter substrate-binding protein n=1 Tax=Actinomyces sp. B33 TaxID=2942131 RepID=UPI0023423AF5|nr:metal ABC transporter substrate-binding protein [Actinomyces sp. B33]MDC4232771.1 metal ABC transporter substrate-binding protein [Actinomyces sp. B33]